MGGMMNSDEQTGFKERSALIRAPQPDSPGVGRGRYAPAAARLAGFRLWLGRSRPMALWPAAGLVA